MSGAPQYSSTLPCSTAHKHHQQLNFLFCLAQVEAAYDILFMQSMKKRLTGELEVSSSVRFADVPDSRKSTARKGKDKNAKQGAVTKLPIPVALSVQSPKEANAKQQLPVFGALVVWALAQVCFCKSVKDFYRRCCARLIAAMGFRFPGLPILHTRCSSVN